MSDTAKSNAIQHSLRTVCTSCAVSCLSFRAGFASADALRWRRLRSPLKLSWVAFGLASHVLKKSDLVWLRPGALWVRAAAA
eukprot:3457327-Rhodomonas_salina.1